MHGHERRIWHRKSSAEFTALIYIHAITIQQGTRGMTQLRFIAINSIEPFAKGHKHLLIAQMALMANQSLLFQFPLVSYRAFHHVSSILLFLIFLIWSLPSLDHLLESTVQGRADVGDVLPEVDRGQGALGDALGGELELL